MVLDLSPLPNPHIPRVALLGWIYSVRNWSYWGEAWSLPDLGWSPSSVSFTHSFNEQSQGLSCGPGTVPGTGESVGGKTDETAQTLRRG